VPNVDVPRLRRPLNDGLVLAIEPMLTFGRPELVHSGDGWTISTADNSSARTSSTRWSSTGRARSS
jgi:methionyl aminopeptidase